MEGAEVGEVVVSLWHASPGMGEQSVFLGEIRVTLKGLQKQPTSTTTAWYVFSFFIIIMDSIFERITLLYLGVGIFYNLEQQNIVRVKFQITRHHLVHYQVWDHYV